MKSNELRIGNLIYNPIQKINIVVDGGLIATESMREKGLKDYKGFEPIPLTEEWLLKFGFWFNEDSDYYHCGSNEEIRIDSNDLAFCYGDSWNFPTVKHVHQLQNLYFALTGEELKIK